MRKLIERAGRLCCDGGNMALEFALLLPAVLILLGGLIEFGSAMYASSALESAARDDGTVHPGAGETSLLIAPGFEFRVVDRLLTNFLLPRSTLLMLVAAFAGYDLMMTAYRHAVAAGYRFYSYGDAMLIC